jgi:hypothetical protein
MNIEHILCKIPIASVSEKYEISVSELKSFFHIFIFVVQDDYVFFIISSYASCGYSAVLFGHTA